MMQGIIVAVIVAIAVWVVAVRLLPRGLRMAIRGRAATVARAVGWHALAGRLSAMSSAAAGGCGGCDGCAPAKPAQKEFAISAEALRRTARRQG
jgi:hypothetical protein